MTTGSRRDRRAARDIGNHHRPRAQSRPRPAPAANDAANSSKASRTQPHDNGRREEDAQASPSLDEEAKGDFRRRKRTAQASPPAKLWNVQLTQQNAGGNRASTAVNDPSTSIITTAPRKVPDSNAPGRGCRLHRDRSRRLAKLPPLQHRNAKAQAALAVPSQDQAGGTPAPDGTPPGHSEPDACSTQPRRCYPIEKCAPKGDAPGRRPTSRLTGPSAFASASQAVAGHRIELAPRVDGIAVVDEGSSR